MALKSGRVGIHPSQVDPITGMLLSGPSGTSDYEQLSNLPKINSVTLKGNKSLSDLGVPTSFEDMSDSDISSPEEGQILQYNGTGWENVFASISPVTPATLASLEDVRLTSLSNGQILVYDGTAELWDNADYPTIPDSVSDLSDGYTLTPAVTALTGATSVVFSNAAIHTTSIIEPFANMEMAQPTITVIEGQCTLSFSALAADTSFKLRITN